MSDEEIEIEIDALGKVTITTKGIKGPRCLDIAELFTKIIGQEESRQLTSEYYENSEHIQNSVEVHRRTW